MKPKPTFFEFVSYRFEPRNKRAFFVYTIHFSNRESLSFTETIVLPKVPVLKNIPGALLENTLESIHLALGVSYYKLYCPKKVKSPYVLTKDQADFWNTIYHQGLGEFFYRNHLDPKQAPRFAFSKSLKKFPVPLKRKDRSLVGVGGGKDSIVAAELLREYRHPVTAFLLETNKNADLIKSVVKQMEVSSLRIERFLDKKIFEKYEESYNGHIPISIIYAFLGILSAILYDYAYVVVGNEYGSNFGNIVYKGESINHQWSKTSEFEELFRKYVNAFITPDIAYFSLLRPFYEIRIVEQFSRYRKYLPYFSSCNRNFLTRKDESTRLWCTQCPKCAFAFTMLSVFLSPKDLFKIFGKNLYDDEKLIPMFRDLLGFGDLKPFDCVGTFEETKAAFYLVRDKFKDSIALKTFEPRIRDGDKLAQEVFKAYPAPFIPARFQFLGMKSAYLMGYGREGRITERYLKKRFPALKIGIGGEDMDANYLATQKGFDIAVKTPGIPKKLLAIPHTTATNLFFSEIKNIIIGVTGSKGKSTTASLIYSILKEAKKPIELLGNIGNPMLEVLLDPVDSKQIFVLELSSYQLDDIQYSPHISVVTNLFPEHMNYHGGLDPYYNAKKNIINFQNHNDFFVYNPKDKILKSWSRNAMSRPVSFTERIPLKEGDIPLLGQHNRENIKAAIAVAKLFKISDKIIRQAVKKFKPLPHRLERVGTFRGITFYDDAISTTPESTIQAIRSLPNIGTIFLGGEDRGYDFSLLEKTIRKYKIKNIVLFPDTGKRIFISEIGLNILHTSDMKAAVEFAYRNTPKGAICLLSTASPSYSLWKNFEEKGDQFQKLIKSLGNS